MSAEVIARLKAAERGDRDLDADVMEAIGFQVRRRAGSPPMRRGLGGISWRFRSPGDSHWQSLPAVSTSIDDAMRWVPTGWKFRRLEFAAPADVPWQATLLRATGNGLPTVSEGARTGPLALCAVILRVRENGALYAALGEAAADG